MYDFLLDVCSRPSPFSRYTARELWTTPHLSQRMLSFHLDPNTQLASRPVADIDQCVAWIDDKLGLGGKRVCDLGCGPGLYAQRFCEKGAQVTGMDFSERAIRYAADSTDPGIRYLQADYLDDDLPTGFDIVTLIYTDLCVLSPAQRSTLLAKVRRALNPNGHLVVDVCAMGAFARRQETTVMEKNLMDGFWSSTDYIGLQRSYLYRDLSLALDRYHIVEPTGTWEIFNWFQHYSPDSISAELAASGFVVEEIAGDLKGLPLTGDCDVLGVVARRP